MLRKPQIASEINKRLAVYDGMSKEGIERDLIDAREMAREQGDPSTWSKISMDIAKLRGYLIDRQQVTHMSEHQKDEIRRLVIERITSEERT